MIETKLSKEKIKKIAKLQQKKFRKLEQKTIVEGERIIDQLVRNNIKLQSIFVLESRKDYYNSFVNNLNAEQVFFVDETQLKKITDTQTPQSIAAIVSIPKIEFDDFRFILYLDDIKDPGNLGTIFRSAAAAGVTGVVLSNQCCELFNPKVVRSSLGTVFFIPFLSVESDWIENQNAQVIVTELSNACSVYDFVPQKENLILVIGSEANGISEKIKNAATDRIYIPMKNNIESLNAAIAASICMFEIARKL